MPHPSSPLGPRSRSETERIGARDLARWGTAAGRWAARQASRQLGPTWSALAASLAVGGAFALVLAWAAGETYEAVAEQDGAAAFDRPVLDAMVRLRGPGLNRAVTWFTDVGGPVLAPVVATLVAVLLCLLWRRWSPLVLMMVGGAVALGITVLGKHLVARARPPLALAVPPYESSPSFPSGHTLNATVVAGITAYLLLIHWRRAWARAVTLVVAAAYAVAMGLSRVVLGHHWLTDVIAGWLLGLAWVAVVVTAHRLELTVRRARRS